MTEPSLLINERMGAESKSLATGSTAASPCSALDWLLKELLTFYVSAEKVHWHLLLNPVALGGTSALPERFARDMCSKTLETASLIMRLKCIFDHKPDRECTELMSVIATKQSELHALNGQLKDE
jgi:hypothetical protein